MQLHQSHGGLPKWQQIISTKRQQEYIKSPSISIHVVNHNRTSKAATTVKIYSRSKAAPILTSYGIEACKQTSTAYSILTGYFKNKNSTGRIKTPRWHSNIKKPPMEQRRQGNSSHVDHQGSRIQKKDPHRKQRRTITCGQEASASSRIFQRTHRIGMINDQNNYKWVQQPKDPNQNLRLSRRSWVRQRGLKLNLGIDLCQFFNNGAKIIQANPIGPIAELRKVRNAECQTAVASLGDLCSQDLVRALSQLLEG
ncbi:hypothetical protein Nepgr_030027 [Nepenthes gracilis]|uniref:Uncharacterized protein n=1 Tax=Nepenthes gracilis TaxID=150966 RepID=A0AAD3Y5P1_NEPGR|nr:hypothetical protein Nepgr_030027 [Nepenthes gracilis]